MAAPLASHARVQVVDRASQAAVAGAAAGEHAVEVPVGLGVARPGEGAQVVGDRLLEVDAVLVALLVDAVGFAEGAGRLAGKRAVGHHDMAEAVADDVAVLGVQARHAGDLAVVVGVGLVGIVGVVLVPALVGQFHEAAAVELLLQLALQMIGVVAERRGAHARRGVVIAADREGDTVAQRLDRGGVPEVAAALAVGGAGRTDQPAALIVVQPPRDEVDRGAGRVLGQDARGSALQAFDMVDGEVVLEHLVVGEAAVDFRHAVFFQTDEGLAAAGKAAHRIVVGHRAGRPLDVNPGDGLQHVGGGPGRLLQQLLLSDVGHRHRGVQQGALAGGAGDHHRVYGRGVGLAGRRSHASAFGGRLALGIWKLRLGDRRVRVGGARSLSRGGRRPERAHGKDRRRRGGEKLGFQRKAPWTR